MSVPDAEDGVCIAVQMYRALPSSFYFFPAFYALLTWQDFYYALRDSADGYVGNVDAPLLDSVDACGDDGMDCDRSPHRCLHFRHRCT